jgi:hypothetical protein
MMMLLVNFEYVITFTHIRQHWRNHSLLGRLNTTYSSSVSVCCEQVRTVRYFKGLEKVHNELLGAPSENENKGEHKENKGTAASAASAASSVGTAPVSPNPSPAATSTPAKSLPSASTSTAGTTASPAATPSTGGSPAAVPNQSSMMAGFMMGKGIGGL